MSLPTREDVQKSIDYVELLQIRFREPDGLPKNASTKRQVEYRENMEAMRQLTQIRQTLYRAKDCFEN